MWSARRSHRPGAGRRHDPRTEDTKPSISSASNATASRPRDAGSGSFHQRRGPPAHRLRPTSCSRQTVLVEQQTLEAAAHRVAELEAAQHQDASNLKNMAVFSAISAEGVSGGGAPAAPQQPGYDPSAYQRAPAPPPPAGLCSTSRRKAILRQPPQGNPGRTRPIGAPRRPRSGDLLRDAA